MNAALFALDAIEPAVSSYVAIWTPLFESAKASGLAPDFLLHWGRASATDAEPTSSQKAIPTRGH